MAQDGLLFRNFGVRASVVPDAFARLAVSVRLGCCSYDDGSYEVLLSYCTFGAWIFYAMVVAGLLLLRKRRPDARAALSDVGLSVHAGLLPFGGRGIYRQYFVDNSADVVGRAGADCNRHSFFYFRRQRPLKSPLRVTSRGAASL